MTSDFRLPDEVMERIRADVARWKPGLWAAEVGAQPPCLCGTKEPTLRWAKGAATLGEPSGFCQRHQRYAP